MTALTERIPLDEISQQAREVKIGHTLLTIIASVLFAVGWLAARGFYCLAWAAVAVKVGWREGRGTAQSRTG